METRMPPTISNLLDHGFKAPKSGVAGSAIEAVNLANSIGYPVVMKIESPDILHKTDVGGVALDIKDAAAVEAAFSAILANVRQNLPDVPVSQVRVEELCSGGIEVIIGLNRDPQFGPVIMFGLGGVLTEVLDDTSFRALPISRADARSMIEELRGAAILQGYRGMGAISIEMLIDLLVNASQFAMEYADALESFDLNPVAVWENDHRVLDVKLVLAAEKLAGESPKPRINHMETFFSARSVALVGASATPGKIGASVLESLINYEYQGDVYPVNPGREEVMGVKAYPSIASIPEPAPGGHGIDLVVVAVSLDNVPGLLDECHHKGIHNMVILSGGGKELGDGDSADMEERIKQKAAELDVRIIGCNCVGVFNGETRLDTFFQSHDHMVRPGHGPIAMFTQSGTVGLAFLEDVESVGVSRFVSYGNRIDVDEADIIAFLENDDQTAVIAGYIEGLEDGGKFLQAAQQAATKKPIVVYKSGRTPRAAQASMSHTGFFGGSYRVSMGVFKQSGLIVVDSYEELVTAAKALALQPRARGNRVAMISNGAGTMIQAMDLFGTMGLEMAPLSAHLLEELKAFYPSSFIVQNPIDITGSATVKDYKIGIEALMEDPNVDIVMPWIVLQNKTMHEGIIDMLSGINTAYDKPMVCGAFGGAYTREVSQGIEAAGVPVCRTVRDWVAAARCLVGLPAG
jgi:3-hydroxypropionyl-CoA synthetase (ADP-forming)